MPPLHNIATARNSYQMSLYKWHSSWYHANANRHDIAARFMTFPLVSFHSDQVFDPPAASSARKSLKQFYFFSHFFTFFFFSSRKLSHSSWKTTNSLKIIFTIEERKDPWTKLPWTTIGGIRDARNLTRKRRYFRHGRNMLKTGCMEQVSKSKDPLGLLSATLNRITITVTRAKGTSNPFSLNVLSLAARCYELPGPFKQTFLSYLVTKAIWKKTSGTFRFETKGSFRIQMEPGRK